MAGKISHITSQICVSRFIFEIRILQFQITIEATLCIVLEGYYQPKIQTNFKISLSSNHKTKIDNVIIPDDIFMVESR